MAEQWHFTLDGKPMGPAPLAELRRLATRGLLRPTDLVWQEGMSQWVRAGQVQGLVDEMPPPGTAAGGQENGSAEPGPTPGATSGVDVPKARSPSRSQEPRSTRGEGDLWRERNARPGRRRPSRAMSPKARLLWGLAGLLVAAGVVVGLTALIVHLADDSPPQAAKRPPPAVGPGQLVSRYQINLQENQQDTRWFNLVGGGRYEVRVDSALNSDVDLFVVDEQHNELAKDELPDANCFLTFVAPRSERYRIELDNLGPGDNRCTVTIRRLDVVK